MSSEYFSKWEQEHNDFVYTYESDNAREETGDPNIAELQMRFGSQLDTHKDHDYEVVETLYDNYAEYTRWAYCQDCRTEFITESSTIVGGL